MPTLHTCVECAHAEWREQLLFASDFSLFEKTIVVDVLWCRLKNREVLPYEPACKDFRPKGGERRAKIGVYLIPR